tara:strand:+ start:215 stop:1066 length:852 start_codon:yes stop_codon:yes gene_type:complete
MQEIYKINGADFLNPSSEYLDKESYPNFQKKLEEFKSLLAKQVENNSGISYFKFGDGDYYFLKKQPKGSAKPGNRALSKKYWRINHKEFANGSKENDYFMCEIMKQNREYFYELFSKDFDFPGEFVYGLLSNKWLLKNFKNEIGIIGAKEKIEIINELMKRTEYQEYLGIDKFNDYIVIPQKFACDNLEETREQVKKQLRNSASKIFLLGVGHVKSGLNHLLPEYKKAVYLDVGSGIDALAGIVDKERPYFGSWQNYKLKNDKFYRNVDYLHFNFDGSEKVIT